MQEREVYGTQFAVRSQAEVVSARLEVHRQHEVVTADMIGGEGQAAVALRRITDGESDPLILWQTGQIELAEPLPRVVAVLTRDGVGLARGRGEVRVRDVVQVVEVFKLAIGSVKAKPLVLLSAHAHVAVGVCTPAGRSYKKSIKETARVPLLLPYQKTRIEEARACFVVQVALILVNVAANSKTAVAKLYTGNDCIVSGVFSDLRIGGA